MGREVNKSLDEVMAELDRKRNDRGWTGLWYWTTYGCYRVRDKIRDVPRQIRWARQRVFRGWDDRAVWSLDNHVAETLGAQLILMAEIAHGYPPGYGSITPRTEDSQFIPDEPDGDETFNRWAGDLRKHGEALLAYQKSQYDVYGDAWEALYQPAREALVWVADNFGSLWD